jgi:glycerol kinase
MGHYILSMDQGTTSCRAIVFQPDGKVLGVGQKEFHQSFPKPGWVEHDANEILATQIVCIREAVRAAAISPNEIACVGITNQRETTVVWNRKTMEPIHPAIVWQCRRTAELAELLKEQSDFFRRKTGLIPDAYFSGPKIRWILDNVAGARAMAKNGELAFGTIDSWLIAKLANEQHHLTEPSNASRTMLFNIKSLTWDDELLNLLEVPRNMMPDIVASNGNFGTTRSDLLGFSAPISAVLGDQQAALFGQCCFQPGMFKCTYGTGSFLLGNIGTETSYAKGLLTTIAWKLADEETTYAVEGSTFIAGAAIQWLRDNLQVIASSEESEALAESIGSNEGVYFVPALVGLGSPWWDSSVRGSIVGLTRGTGKAHLARAALESMAYQIKDIAEEIKHTGLRLTELRVDGGATKNGFMLQFQSDLLNIPVTRAQQVEATAWGVAALAAVTNGLTTRDKLSDAWQAGLTINPKQERSAQYNGWKAALQATLSISKSNN